MTNSINVLLVGIGGYGNGYVRELLQSDNSEVRIAGVVDPNPQSCKYIAEINKRNIPVFSSMHEFYKKNSADLAVISSPIQFHCPQTCYALENGSNVLCEKPLCATVQEAEIMKKAAKETGKFVAIGYQWSYTPPIQKLKKDIMSGVFGKAVRLKTVVLWPRDKAYYGRSSWAAKIKDSNERWILDSVANNATAHFIHNMFYVLGDRTDLSAMPVTVTAELYRANNIENFDTAVFRVITENEAEVLYYGTHAIEENRGPILSYEFENATVFYDWDRKNQGFKAVFKDGREKDYGDPEGYHHNKLWAAIDAVKGKSSIVCGIEAAAAHTLCINGLYESSYIENFNDKTINFNEEKELVWVKGLSDALLNCYTKCVLPSELDYDWAKNGQTVSLKGYEEFEGGKL